MIQALLVTICLVVFPYQGSSIILESGKVNDYEVVYPQKVPALSKRGLQNPQPETKYEDRMQYEFHVNGKPVVLHLERNKGLFSEDYTETHYSPDGKEITTSLPVQDHCYYHGYIENEAASSAAISACDGLKGHFKHQGETYLIEPLKLSDGEAHAVYKDEDVEKEDGTPKICGVTQTTWESDEPVKKASQLVVTPEQESYLQDQKYIKFYLVVDNLMWRKYSGNLTAIRTRLFESVNILNVIFKRLNFLIVLIGIECWSEEDQIDVQSDVDATLGLFREWRQRVLLPRKWNDNTQLLTGLDLSGSIIGYGYLGVLCSPELSVALVQDYSKIINSVASIMAHEMGHNMGINHDEDSCNCGSNSCIMSAELGFVPSYVFSPCSYNEHWTYLINNRPECILNKPVPTDIVSPPRCGNSLVEVGEECDCGSPEDCQSACCNATTCNLMPGAQCDSEECCEQCRFKGAGAECRAAKDDCDAPELCTGESAECPTDGFQRNGHPCQNNQGYCYNARCPTLANQCIALFGSNKTVAADICFENNRLGNNYGYCRGEDGVNIPCEPEDEKCGRLYCTEKSSGNTIQCFYGLLPGYPDYGMVEPGTKCGDGKVCLNRQCVDMETAY